MKTMKTMFIATYEHRHGKDVEVFATQAEANGVVNAFDENDYCGKFPFNRPHPEVSSTLATPCQ